MKNVEMEITESNLFDKVEYHFNVAIQVLTNSVTGEQSIGWVPMESSLCEEWLKDDNSGGEEE